MMQEHPLRTCLVFGMYTAQHSTVFNVELHPPPYVMLSPPGPAMYMMKYLVC
jgi:hypothetical protein